MVDKKPPIKAPNIEKPATNAGGRGRGRGGDRQTRGRGQRRGQGRGRGLVRDQPTSNARVTPQICIQFQRTGQCQFGVHCKYSHDIGNNAANNRSGANSRSGYNNYKGANNGNQQPAGASSARRSVNSPKASEDVGTFLKSLEKLAKQRGGVPRLNNDSYVSLWRAAWTALSVGASPASAPACLTILLRLPASSSIAPPPTEVLKVIAAMASHVKGNNRLPSAVLEAFELVADVFKRRLIGHANGGNDGLQIIENIRASVHDALMDVVRDPALAQRASRLLGELLGTVQKYELELERTDDQALAEHDENNTLAPWNGWQAPTLSWLQRGSWLDASPLASSYESIQQYADTLREMVTMLTFYWGAGAVFPKCRVRGHDERSCDQPMCVPIAGQTKQKCSNRSSGRQTCNGVSVFQCSRHGHDAICPSCLRRSQVNLIGAPGPRASTDVYDAVIERETLRRGGIVYIASELSSRKPPAISPSWRTTYRLKCSALVAVVRLAASSEPLPSRAKIDWAEVVRVQQQTGFDNDHEHRARGRLALRLLTRADICTLNQDGDSLQVGQRVAIIDLQVFVPEVVPVLSALADPGFIDNLNNIRFAPRLIGSAVVEEEKVNQYGDDVTLAIRSALETTEIDLVNRLSDDLKQNLCRDIAGLAKRATLTGTQLSAFAAALSNGLHLTQGPPGTGKSYLGVQLILALDHMRTVAARAGQAVGPIIVLSYKNHALDEILIDLLKEERHWGSRGLIRCGKSEDEKLHPYAEKHSMYEWSAQDVLSTRVSCLRTVRRIARDLRTLRSVLGDETGLALQEWIPNQKEWGTGVDAAVVCLLQILRLNYHIPKSEETPTGEVAYSALENLVHTENNMLTTERLVLLKTIPKLSNEMPHWKSQGSCRVKFFLKKWLSGEEPPPRCAAAKEDGCGMASELPDSYCEVHRCMYPGTCLNRRTAGYIFCEDHRCKSGAKACVLPRISNGQICLSHACEYCIRTECREVLAKVGEACRGHTCREEGCPDGYLSVLLEFCRHHTCLRCHSLVEKHPEKVASIRCVEGSSFCREHKCTGRSCKNERMHDDVLQDFCTQHACIACSGMRRRIDERPPLSKFCVEHRCSQMDPDEGLCEERRMDRSEFCDDHTCRFCLQDSDVVSRPVRGSEPRNVCREHPLCNHTAYDGSMCNERTCKSSKEYCFSHFKRDSRRMHVPLVGSGVTMQCSGKAKRTNQRCKSTGSTSEKTFYCNAHISQRSFHDFEDESSDIENGNDDSSVSEGRGFGLAEELAVPHAVENFQDPFGASDEQLQKQQYFNQNDTSDSMIPKEGSDAIFYDIETSNEAQQIDSVDATLSVQVAPTTDGKCLETEKPSIVTVGEKPLEGDRFRDSNGEIDGNEKKENTPSPAISDSDVEVPERTAYGTCQDEMEVTSSDESDEEIAEELPDNLQHLHDIVGNESTDGSDSDEEDKFEEITPGEQLGESALQGSLEWAWGIPLSERWRLVTFFLGGACTQITRLAEIADAFVESARQDLAEAGAFTFKNARVIGATVVGATRRLQSLRACEPFAMIVEEACEVMEPTLLSVLAVRSLQKLEMIGDHRQLPAFIQPCLFSMQTTHPSIKVSLFERLLKNNKSLCTVLDVQRRMRPEISDLTRCEYEDVVEVVDHECTVSQHIADRVVKSPTQVPGAKKMERLKATRKLWSSEGRLVPGVSAQVFFWDLQTKEGRAAVGLSRCNYGEAEACIELVKWLTHCGVPAGCISIITPFKGQKVTIVKGLRNISDSQARNVFVSTVDRYQGDENDIVILSLVSTRPGNRFVALRNRFIVSTSRARIGFYIIGSAEAVTKTAQGGAGPLHWRRLLQDLGQQSQVDKNISDEAKADATTRIGRTLRICCPRHNDVFRDVSAVTEFPTSGKKISSFCTQRCAFILGFCGHSCQLPCHSIDMPHTSSCPVVVERPCRSHADVQLHCHEVQSSVQGWSRSLADALINFKCDVVVPYRRPECPHVVELPCWKYQDLLGGHFDLTDCQERVEDFVNPSCGHRIPKPACMQRRQWEESSPDCLKVVTHQRDCGCRAKMTCHDSVKESSLETPLVCLEAVVSKRPRCSHELSSRCHEATLLHELWKEQSGESVSGNAPVVSFGVNYGPAEAELGMISTERLNKKFNKCLVRTRYHRSCSHEMQVRCADAFVLAAGEQAEPPCQESVRVCSPLCGHMIDGVPCHLGNIIKTLPSTLFVENIYPDTGILETIAGEDVLMSAAKLDPILKKVSNLCNGQFAIMRKCGHKTESIPCMRLLPLLSSKRLQDCNVDVQMGRSCGHSYKIPCSQRGNAPPICIHPVDGLFAYPSCQHGHEVRVGVCHKLAELSTAEDLQCPVLVCSRRYRCTHVTEVHCHLEKRITVELPGHRLEPDSNVLVVHANVDYCEPAFGVPNCLEPVVFRRSCDHEDRDVPCHKAFEWAAAPETAGPCKVLTQAYSPLCQHSVKIQCVLRASLVDFDPWNGNLPTRITAGVEGSDAITIPVVDQNMGKPSWSNILNDLNCGQKTRLQRTCGHEKDIPCETIFKAFESSCESFEKLECEDCGHINTVICHEINNQQFCQNMVEKRCAMCNVNTTKVECFKEKAFCKSEVCATRDCGHNVKWVCGRDEVPRLRPGDGEYQCLTCLRDQWKEKLEVAKVLNSDDDDGKGKEVLLVRSAEILGVDTAKLFKELCDLAEKVLPDGILTLSSQSQGFSFESLFSAYYDILQVQVDMLSDALISTNTDISFKQPPNLGDVACYDMVYTVLERKQTPAESIRMVDTQYGFGTRATLLSLNALNRDNEKRGGRGELTICICAAFSNQGIGGVDPFRKSKDELRRLFDKSQGKKQTGARSNKEFKRKCTKDNQLARAVMQKFICGGYDYICRKESQERVYWKSGAVFPLLTASIQLSVTCEICFDDILPVKAWRCPEGHVLCGTCFTRVIEEAMKADSLRRTLDGDGNVLCPHDSCGLKYEILHLMTQGHEKEEMRKTFESLEELRMRARSQKDTSEALEQQKMQMQKEFQRIQNMSNLEERQAETLRLEIVEDILTLRCPVQNCRMAFLDFQGCFALRCGNTQCSIGFCAWCIDHHSHGNIHGHVANCNENRQRGELFNSLEVFNTHHRERKKRLLIEKLRGKDVGVQKRTLKLIRTYLIDLRINISEVELGR